MDKNYILQIILNYLSYLKSNGTVERETTDNIFILTFLEEFINSATGIFLELEDFDRINNYLYTIYGSNCLLPYPKYQEFRSNKEVTTISDKRVRITQGNDLRVDNNNKLRVATP